MNDAIKRLDAILQNASAGSQPFPPSSRYNGQPILTHVAPDGRETPYLARRVVPPPDRFATVQTYTVQEGDRLDSISARHAGDPEQWWRLADANGAVRPAELTEAPGRKLRITLGEGIPAGGDE
jgi:nucleoid-associated protein YgaU